ncbi:dienelactone hydrolase family protein (plasmid) [Hymenobacter tibetensis]|uniref:Dienelactone hydrolase family protein n=1 Tax=Hymenobacter tibetensis TaxID=497967 RepID=A0ABY4D500_9BACT|nr:dienelactone hydrolase family protein [Hymenobacter tibetensis]UOG77583.1 dienelactone hydrolase family protein [Hymenobacter tibetensis]
MHQEPIRTAGQPLSAATKALILLHGRGGSAADILSLSAHLHVPGFALLAPQASANTWYPHSFLAPTTQNEPYLTAALAAVGRVVAEAENQGLTKENLYFLGFSQGACLTLEYVARHATRYGGVVAFTGGVIGDKVNPDNYAGDFAGTPVFLGTSDPDFHVPVERVHASTELLRSLGADVTEQVYPHMGHTITQEEIKMANQLIFKQPQD